MTAYIYRVTSERVKLTDGSEANLAKYAYKPSFSDSKWNSQMDFRSGCPASRKLAKDGKLTGKVVFETTPGADVFKFRYGTFVDDSFKGVKQPRLKVANPNSRTQQLWTVEYVNTGATILGGENAGKHPVETKVVPADSFTDAVALVRSMDDRYLVQMPTAPAFTTMEQAWGL